MNVHCNYLKDHESTEENVMCSFVFVLSCHRAGSNRDTLDVLGVGSGGGQWSPLATAMNAYMIAWQNTEE